VRVTSYIDKKKERAFSRPEKGAQGLRAESSQGVPARRKMRGGEIIVCSSGKKIEGQKQQARWEQKRPCQLGDHSRQESGQILNGEKGLHIKTTLPRRYAKNVGIRKNIGIEAGEVGAITIGGGGKGVPDHVFRMRE